MNERSSYVTRSRVEARQSSPVVIQRSVELWRSRSDQLFSRMFIYLFIVVLKSAVRSCLFVTLVVFERNVNKFRLLLQGYN